VSFVVDVLILDFKIRIESICAKTPTAHILMSRDASALANSGFIIIRNSWWALQFLKDWLNERSLFVGVLVGSSRRLTIFD
jgi:hypothetical protein